MKLPSLQFYTGDWMKDPYLRSCSPAARGIWIDMLCLMFECNPRGYLQHPGGKPIEPNQLARMTGCAHDEVVGLLEELESAGVFSRTDGGVIFSRRLIRDEHIRAERSKAGKLGAPHGHKGGRPRKSPGNGKNGKNNPPGVTGGVTFANSSGVSLSGLGKTDNPGNSSGLPETAKTANERAKKPHQGGQTKGQNNPPSSSSSDLNPPLPPEGETRVVSEKIPDPPKKARRPDAVDPADLALPIPPALDTPEFRAAWQSWLEYRLRRKKSAPVEVHGGGITLKMLAPYGSAQAVELIEQAIAAGWQGIVYDRAKPIAAKPPAQNVVVKTAEDNTLFSWRAS